MKEQPNNERACLDTSDSWLRGLRIYLVVSILLHGVWETLQLPLYTIWYDQPWSKQLFAVVHCTLGDAMIAALSLLIVLTMAATSDWPASGLARTAAITIVLGLSYTVYSEWMNVNVRGSWAYAPAMPTLPVLGTGLSPLLQWTALPLIAFGTMHYILDLRRGRRCR